MYCTARLCLRCALLPGKKNLEEARIRRLFNWVIMLWITDAKFDRFDVKFGWSGIKFDCFDITFDWFVISLFDWFISHMWFETIDLNVTDCTLEDKHLCCCTALLQFHFECFECRALAGITVDTCVLIMKIVLYTAGNLYNDQEDHVQL